MSPIRKSLLMIAAIVVICGAQQLAQADPLVLSLQNNSFSYNPWGECHHCCVCLQFGRDKHKYGHDY